MPPRALERISIIHKNNKSIVAEYRVRTLSLFCEKTIECYKENLALRDMNLILCLRVHWTNDGLMIFDDSGVKSHINIVASSGFFLSNNVKLSLAMRRIRSVTHEFVLLLRIMTCL